MAEPLRRPLRFSLLAMLAGVALVAVALSVARVGGTMLLTAGCVYVSPLIGLLVIRRHWLIALMIGGLIGGLLANLLQFVAATAGWVDQPYQGAVCFDIMFGAAIMTGFFILVTGVIRLLVGPIE